MLSSLVTLNHCDEIAFVTSKVIVIDGLVSVVLVYAAGSLYIKTTSVSALSRALCQICGVGVV